MLLMKMVTAVVLSSKVVMRAAIAAAVFLFSLLSLHLHTASRWRPTRVTRQTAASKFPSREKQTISGKLRQTSPPRQLLSTTTAALWSVCCVCPLLGASLGTGAGLSRRWASGQIWKPTNCTWFWCCLVGDATVVHILEGASTGDCIAMCKARESPEIRLF